MDRTLLYLIGEWKTLRPSEHENVFIGHPGGTFVYIINVTCINKIK